jgi:hypothetical protein
VFENRELRRIFGPKRDEVTGGCRKLHNEELRDFCSQVKEDQKGGTCSTNERRDACVDYWWESQKKSDQ